MSAAARTPQGGPLHFGCIEFFHMNISMWTSLSGSAPNPLWLRLTSDGRPYALKGHILSVYIISDTSGNKSYWLDKPYKPTWFL